jgi:oligopeptide transport system permease protein
MWRFLLSRVAQSVVVLIGILTLIFALQRMAPGNPFVTEKAIPEHLLASMRSYYGLDKPVLEQWINIMRNYFVRFDGGPSFTRDGFTVNEIIADSLPVSLIVGGAGLMLALGLGVPLGVIAAARRNQTADYVASAIALAGICLPTFVVGPLSIAFFALKLGWFASVGWEDLHVDWILPSIVLGLFYMGYIARITRAGMLEALSQDYVRTATAKGLSEWRILVVHTLRHGLLPLISYLGPAIGGILAGSFVVESIFGLPGLGLQFVGAARDQDWPLIMGTSVTFGAMVLLFNFLSDLALYWMNPRMRGTGGEWS